MITIRITSADKNWGRVAFFHTGADGTFRMGTLAPRLKEIDELIAGAKLAGWIIEDKRE